MMSRRSIKRFLSMITAGAVALAFLAVPLIPCRVSADSGSMAVDGLYGEWSDIPVTEITYRSYNGTSVHIAQLHTDGEYLYGHLKLSDYFSGTVPFGQFYMKVNNTSQEFHICVDGNYYNNNAPVDPGTTISNLSVGINGSRTGWSPLMTNSSVAYTVYDDGRAPEMEFKVSLADIARAYGITESEIGTITLSNTTLGNESVTVAGTSSGPLIIVIICGAVAMVSAYKLTGRKRSVKALEG